MSKKHLTKVERDRIAQLHCQGESQEAIAQAIGRDPSTISRELRRNSTHGEYLRELIGRMVSRIELYFDSKQVGKRTERPLSKGVIELRPDPLFFKVVSRGDCRSFEPLIAAVADAALSATAETVVATRVLRLSA